MTDKIFYDIDLAIDVKDFILHNDKINFIGDTRDRVVNAKDYDILRVGKSIDSPITIHSVDIITPKFLSKVFKQG
jgi:hypothetical protein